MSKPSAGYNVHREKDRESMLKSLGLHSQDQLFTAIPQSLRLSRDLDLPSAMSEWALERHMRKLAAANATIHTHMSFLGGGFYDHHIPAVVDAIARRGEFLTAYTPYQPEMSQGLLQALAEYQQALSVLAGLPTVNCSSYDGATALAESAWMGCLATGRMTVAVAESIWPQWRQTLNTYMEGRGVSVITIPENRQSGQIDSDKLAAMLNSKKPAIFVFQMSNGYGVLENVSALTKLCRDADVLSAVSFNPLLTGLFQTPGALGADIACAEGQGLGIPLAAGGPSLGILACGKAFRKYLPGRLVGKVADIYGQPAYALVYEDREQHVARERATSNICSNQALCALRATVYLSLLGDSGIRRLAEINTLKAHYLADALCAIPGINMARTAPFFNEFTIRLPVPASKILARLREKRIFGGLDGSLFGEPNLIVLAVTETKSRADLDYAVQAFRAALKSNS